METMCLLDNGSRVNLIMPEFVKKRNLDVGSIQDLHHHKGRIPLGGMGGNISEPLGYIILRVQIERSRKYTIQGRCSTVPEQLTARHRTVNIGSREQPGVAQS